MNTAANFAACCQSLNPCDILCVIDDAMVKIVTGNRVSSYKIGEETTSLQNVSIADLTSLRADFAPLCAAIDPNAVVEKRRFNNCLQISDRTCSPRRRGGC
jgi:hypothetical protein